MLRTKPIPCTPVRARARALVSLLALAGLAALVAPAFFSARAHAQQPANQGGQQSAPRTKRLTPLKTSDGAQGSRVTITSDGELNDYSAYRSGDRFIVIIPQAQGGEGSGAKGRGFEGAQVSRRGNDLVYTFKLAPGASARVNQRFNRLDVQFTAPAQAGANAQATPQPTPRAPAEISGIKPAQTPNTQPTPALARTTPMPANAQTTTGATNPTPATGTTEVSPSLSITPAPTPIASPSVEPSLTPQAATPAPEQIAQAQPAPSAPVNIVSQTPAATTSPLGAVIARNLPWIIIGMFVIGGILLVARFRDRPSEEPLPPHDEPPALKARRADNEIASLGTTSLDEEATLVTAAPTATSTKSAPVVAASTVAAAAAAAETARGKSKKAKRRRDKEERRNARRATQAEAVAQPAKADATKQAAPAQTASAQPAATAPAATAPSAQPTGATADASALDQSAASVDQSSTSGALKTAAEVAAVVAPVAAAGALLHARAEEKAAEPAAPAADTERIGEEIRKLLAGDPYDESVVGARDTAARDLVASELSAALASRQPARNARAREAFLRHGYFEDTTRHLQSAEAPAQRASAAHTLSLVRDRRATPHLVAALEDPSAEVRRASVEALADLRDPAALEPLEALRWRETSRLVPRALIMRAIEAATPAPEATDLKHEGERAKTREDSAAPTTTAEATTTATAEAAATETAPAEAMASQPALAEAPAVETPTVETSAVETPTVETPALEAPALEAPTVEETFEAPRVEAATVEASAVEAQAAEAPGVEAAAAESPALEASPVEAAAVGAAALGAVAVEAAAAEVAHAPEAEAPSVAGESEAAPAHVAESSSFEFAPHAAEGATPEGTGPVYTFDEAAYASARAERAAEADLHGTGGLDASMFGETGLPRGGAPLAQVYSAPEFALAEEAGAQFEAGGTEARPFEGRAFDADAFETNVVAPSADETSTFDAGAAETHPFETDAVESGVIEPGAALASGAGVEDDWLDLTVEEQHVSEAGGPVLDMPAHVASSGDAPAAQSFVEADATAGVEALEQAAPLESRAETAAQAAEDRGAGEAAAPYVEKGLDIVGPADAVPQKGIDLAGADAGASILPKSIQLRLDSEDVAERAASVRALARLSTGEAFSQICAAFDDPSPDVRNAAARALYDVSEDRADTFTRALRESSAVRRRQIGAALSSSGLADEAVSQLTGASRERTYDAFSLLFLMAKAGETAPLIRAIEAHPDTEVRLAVVKLLALSGQHEVLQSFKRLAVRGSLPAEVRSAVMEAIYQISSAGAQPTKPTGM